MRYHHVFLLALFASLIAACGGDSKDAPPSSNPKAGADSSANEAPPEADRETIPAEIAICYKSTEFVCLVEQKIFLIVNERRLSKGLLPYLFSQKLGYGARRWSQNQAQTEKISHAGFPAVREEFIKNEFGEEVQVRVLGENVAQNHMKKTATQTARDIVEQWWNSPQHRENLLGNFSAMGVGVAFFGKKAYATQLFGHDYIQN